MTACMLPRTRSVDIACRVTYIFCLGTPNICHVLDSVCVRSTQVELVTYIYFFSRLGIELKYSCSYE